jgi:DEAD/DEAH box helicase domain-containing protein
VFLYDGVAGGAGLAEQGYRDLDRLIGETRGHVAACACEDGCPACIQSPRCGNGNKPLDKEACVRVLSALAGLESIVPLDGDAAVEAVAPAGPLPERPAVNRRHGITRRLDVVPASPSPPPPDRSPVTADTALPSSGDGLRTVVFDLETRRGAAEVGGWGRIERMGLALAVVYDVAEDLYTTYFEDDVERLLLDLVMADRVVGFNVNRFDLRVLSAYSRFDLGRIRTLDLLETIHARLGFRLKLDHLARENLGESKSADGLQSLRWWKEGKIAEIEAYCRKDVEVTYRLYELGRHRGWLVYRDREDRRVRLPVSWAADIRDPGGRRSRRSADRSGS